MNRKENFVQKGVVYHVDHHHINDHIDQFAGNIVAMLRTIVKQNDRIISLFENEINKKH